ncbi:sensor domain-containing phosphodiesterase [Williamsia serinedens]|uniref:EAL domain, c-di-GMP-specific phosphodiesterase class I (Or its enzymatically inactive variant) n=1 Tax=Williamsia serinedens TaxID=391736 RepID=A0ABT1H6G1_9NOCA|nr:EAL domain-containing protein [Williamsia serinedens]MCP2162830.1 EAL domain, c-di-GMP-specific phosphodiesterase class I (or its enzymatically inactive variant) [Williamsia serinedens]
MTDGAASRAGHATNYLRDGAVSRTLSTTLELAAMAVGFAQARLHILDEHHQYVLAAYGDADSVGLVVDRESTTCRAVVDSAEPLVIADATTATADPALVTPLTAAGLRTYVGVPLFSREHTAIGTLCLTDTDPKAVSGSDVTLLQKYARVVEEQLELQRDRTRLPDDTGLDDVAAALARGEIQPWFQAIVDPSDGTVQGFEALSRWIHPLHGPLTPAHFLPAVRATDIMLDIDLDILRAAATALHGQASTVGDDVLLHVNIEGGHLHRPARLARLLDAVRDAALPSERLCVEIIESTVGDDDNTLSALEALRSNGVHVVVDDLGRGWSSLSRLVHWSIDGFKLDASLTSSLGSPAVDHLLRGLIEHGRANGLMVIAEGIETPQQRDALVELGCPEAQGFLFQRPGPVPTIPPTL